MLLRIDTYAEYHKTKAETYHSRLVWLDEKGSELLLWRSKAFPTYGLAKAAGDDYLDGVLFRSSDLQRNSNKELEWKN